MESVRNEEVRRAHNAAGLVLPDGMPLVWLLWQGFKFADHVTGRDLMLALFNQFEQAGYRHSGAGEDEAVIQAMKRECSRDHLGAAQHTETGTVDGAPSGPPIGACLDRCRDGVRLSRGACAASATLVAKSGAGMGVQDGHGTAAVGQALSVKQSAFLALLAAEKLGLRRLARK